MKASTRPPSPQRHKKHPAAGDLVHELQQQLPGLSGGEGVLESALDSYQPIRGKIPTRPRTDHKPLDRKEHLLRVPRRI